MEFDLKEAIEYYKNQGAPKDQTAFINLLKEIQVEKGSIGLGDVAEISRSYGVKDSFTLAIIKRIPSLRVSDTHCLEICSGPNCSKKGTLNSFVKNKYENMDNLEIKNVQCMRMCGEGPNIRLDGKVYNKVTEEDIKKLIEEIK